MEEFLPLLERTMNSDRSDETCISDELDTSSTVIENETRTQCEDPKFPFPLKSRRNKIWSFCCHLFSNCALQIFLQLFLLLWPLSLGYLGHICLHSCPVFLSLGISMMCLSITTTVAVARRISIFLVPSLYMEQIRETSRHIIAFLEIISLGIFLSQVVIFYFREPSFDPLDENYCERVFYFATYYSNIVFSVLAILWNLQNIIEKIKYLRRFVTRRI
ncbi:hypothetical protein NPIL_616731 [Nephila pilipes]|uniref:Uncharacterized protein n=1 Tax=Nephila pilipes TaxID=299642 RepID=A0A8X6TV01_NEPPI|nr:hypothetical protein NPIL_616731 [Nephila pilipes]